MTRLSKFISMTVAVFAAAFSLCAQSADDILGNFASKKQWDGGRIYDPQRGLVVNLTIRKLPDGNLSVKGSLMGISETFTWNRL